MAAPKGNRYAANSDKKRGPNKFTIGLKETLANICNEYYQGTGPYSHVSDIVQMDPVDRSKIMASILPYIVPKQSVVGVGIDESIKEKLNNLFPFESPDADLQ